MHQYGTRPNQTKPRQTRNSGRSLAGKTIADPVCTNVERQDGEKPSSISWGPKEIGVFDFGSGGLLGENVFDLFVFPHDEGIIFSSIGMEFDQYRHGFLFSAPSDQKLSPSAEIQSSGRGVSLGLCM